MSLNDMLYPQSLDDGYNLSFFRMDNLTYGSFVLHVGYKNHFSAADLVYCISAFLENNVSRSKRCSNYGLQLLCFPRSTCESLLAPVPASLSIGKAVNTISQFTLCVTLSIL